LYGRLFTIYKEALEARRLGLFFRLKQWLADNSTIPTQPWVPRKGAVAGLYHSGNALRNGVQQSPPAAKVSGSSPDQIRPAV